MNPVDPHHYDVIIAPVITEKATLASEHNQVIFRVPLAATKREVKAAVEELFSVKVKAVNTIRVQGTENSCPRSLPMISRMSPWLLALAFLGLLYWYFFYSDLQDQQNGAKAQATQIAKKLLKRRL